VLVSWKLESLFADGQTLNMSHSDRRNCTLLSKQCYIMKGTDLAIIGLN